jgi:hypothetical protein
MLGKVKLALRKTAAVFNDEVADYINSAIADLRLVGISVPEVGSSDTTTGDPLLDRAIILYAKSEDNFGGEGDRYRKAYDYLKCALSLSGDHTESEGE